MDIIMNNEKTTNELTPNFFISKINSVIPNENKDTEPIIKNETFFFGTKEICSFIFDVAYTEKISSSSDVQQNFVLKVRAIRNNPDVKTESFTMPNKAKDDMKLVSSTLSLKYMIYNMSAFKKLLQRMILQAEMINAHLITNIGWQEDGCYAFSNGFISKNGKEIFQIRVDNSIKSHSLKIAPASIVARDTEIEAAKLITNHWFRATKPPVSVFLYLLLVLSFLTTVLREMYPSYAPRFLALLFAEPLSGKTHMCETLRGFMNYIPKVDLSTGSSHCGIMEEAQRCKDCIFLVDDFKIPPQHRKKIESLLELLTRVAGNNSAKKNARGTFKVDSQILITAEAIPDLSESSISRMLIWKLRKSDFIRDEENMIANNSELYASHILMLLRWIISSDTTLLCEKLNDAFLSEKSRINKDGSYCDRRIDAYSWLLATYNVIFCGYANSIDMKFDCQYERLISYALNDLREQQMDKLTKDPLYHFCKNLISQQNRFSPDSYNADSTNNCLGYFTRDYYLVLTDHIEEVIDKRYPIDSKMLLERLKSENIIYIDPVRGKATRHQHHGISESVYKLSTAGIQNYVQYIDKEISRLEEVNHD